MSTTLTAPDRLVPILGSLCALLALSYMALVVITISYATWQSQATSTLTDAQSTIGNLESQYYTDINNINAENPTTLGFVTPTNVQYVAAASVSNASNLSFAGK